MFKKSVQNVNKKRNSIDDHEFEDEHCVQHETSSEKIRKKIKISSVSVTQDSSVSLKAVDPDALALEEPFEVEAPRRQTGTSKPLSAQMDLQQSRCKDFYETGYCGFGDSCKFLHDRPSEGMAAWEAKPKANAVVESQTQDTCGVCGEVWKKCSSPPCRTDCKHFFCESCFFANCKKKCAICGKTTHGVCHNADEIVSDSDSQSLTSRD